MMYPGLPAHAHRTETVGRGRRGRLLFRRPAPASSLVKTGNLGYLEALDKRIQAGENGHGDQRRERPPEYGVVHQPHGL